jgi:hypothetical protein
MSGGEVFLNFLQSEKENAGNDNITGSRSCFTVFTQKATRTAAPNCTWVFPSATATYTLAKLVFAISDLSRIVSIPRY